LRRRSAFSSTASTWAAWSGDSLASEAATSGSTPGLAAAAAFSVGWSGVFAIA
jgi:hypothetical protein